MGWEKEYSITNTLPTPRHPKTFQRALRHSVKPKTFFCNCKNVEFPFNLKYCFTIKIFYDKSFVFNKNFIRVKLKWRLVQKSITPIATLISIPIRKIKSNKFPKKTKIFIPLYRVKNFQSPRIYRFPLTEQTSPHMSTFMYIITDTNPFTLKYQFNGILDILRNLKPQLILHQTNW